MMYEEDLHYLINILEAEKMKLFSKASFYTYQAAYYSPELLLTKGCFSHGLSFERERYLEGVTLNS